MSQTEISTSPDSGASRQGDSPMRANKSVVDRDTKGGATTMFEVTARVKIRDGELDGFKRQAAEMMRQTREKDTRTLRYDWFLSDDGTECEVREGYVDADGLLEHAQNVFEARTKLFRDKRPDSF